jgi:rhodanese-related sulfurtransferase
VASGLPASGAEWTLPPRARALVGDLSGVTFVEDLVGDLGRAQWPRRFETLAWVCGLGAVPGHEHRLVIHNLAAHLERAGRLVLPRHEYLEELATACGLDVGAADGDWVMLRRVDRVTIHDLVHAARERLARVSPTELALALATDTAVVVLDTRTPTDRDRTGVIPGSVHAPRTTLEWQCDPASGYSNAEITSFDQRLVVVCGGGYSSSLAAATLLDLGFKNATDLIGGMEAWIAAGLPLEPPNQTHFS